MLDACGHRAARYDNKGDVMPFINGSHHVTLSVGGAQEDVDFHVGTLGLRFIKKTVLFDGGLPIYHLYYSNANGDPSAVITTFPWKQAGLVGRPGTNQARECNLAVPTGSLNYWTERLATFGVATSSVEVLNTRRLLFKHPSGIDYALIEVADDPRVGYTKGGVPGEYAIHGIYGIGVHVYNPENMVEFLHDSFSGQGLVEEGDRVALRVGKPEHGNMVELVVNRAEEPGTWRYGAGTFHHFAWNLDALDNQAELKAELEGVGYTDVSELKDRTYFKSMYMRTPGGALFELAVTHAEGGWTCDESPEELGQHFMLPPHWASHRAEIMEKLEPVTVPTSPTDATAPTSI
jgi:glyoxalase family protein